MRRTGLTATMSDGVDIHDIVRDFASADSWQALVGELERIAAQLGCAYFALTHHADFGKPGTPGIRIHNYPPAWVQWFDTRGIGPRDPVHRASHVTAAGFHWAEIERLVPLDLRDRHILTRAAAHGIGEGLTIPTHVPGELRGSCSFATVRGQAVSPAVLPLAQIAGTFAFEAARRLIDPSPSTALAQLTPRQLECIVWVARGKTDWEIAQILRVSSATVSEHLRNARARCDAPTRGTLAVRALIVGAISFADVTGR